ncbi:MAG TPA: family 16 glycoside hydrolase [Candidatus Angelobacter sp.]
MATPSKAESTAFSKDILGRFVCNGLDEALRTTDTSIRFDARQFDVIIVGGGSFGAVAAQHLFSKDTTHSHRILVLEGGPFTVPEHVQNLPMLGLNVPGATSIQDLRNQGQFGVNSPREEVWGLPWHSSTPFTGLAYCVGGRSLYFGGWCPQLLDAELTGWPQPVVDDLKNTYFRQASEQIGTNEANDFISGPLHSALRQILFRGIQAGDVENAVPLVELQTHLDNIPAGEEDLSKLEAPLAVQSRTRPGFFPFNKFSSVPLLMRASRSAESECGGDDFKKRLMIVPNCHVRTLVTEDVVVNGQVTKRASRVETSQGGINVPANGVVIIALGTIESARLALASFGNTSNSDLIGRNLMAHLRSNITIRIPRTSLPGNENLPRELAASALFVKGRVQDQGQLIGHFHLQITAAGLNAMGTDSEAELFKKIPDIDLFDRFRDADDTSVVITIRGIGEMQSGNPNSRVSSDAEQDEFSVQRAFVSLAQPSANGSAQSARDALLWDAMDRASDQVARVFANGSPFELFTANGVVKVGPNGDLRPLLPYTPASQGGRRDGLGTTHHEAGTLRFGTDPTTSVTNPDARFHGVSNAYVVGPALFPRVGSPNPMLTGVALARRLGDRLIQGNVLGEPQAFHADPGFDVLFDGTENSFNAWQSAGNGIFSLQHGEIVADPGSDLGLFYYSLKPFGDFILRLEFKLSRVDNNSGVFIRFRDPQLPVPDRAGVPHYYNNKAFVGVDTGFEVQIDELARGNPQQGTPDGLDEHRTGAIYNIPIGPNEGQQMYVRGAALVPERWNVYEIEVHGQDYTVRLNNRQLTQFTNTDLYRGKSATEDPLSGYLGLQSHTGQVRFRNVQIKSLEPRRPRPKRTLERAEVEVPQHSVEAPVGVSEEPVVVAEEKLKAKTVAAHEKTRPKSA